MRRLTTIAAVALAGAALAACAAHPIVARDPVEPPAPDEAYDCDSQALPLNAYGSNCRPRPRIPSTALRARG